MGLRRTQSKMIDFLDLGFGRAERLLDLASRRQHKNKRFMGIEWNKKKGLVTRSHNMKLVYGDALSKLHRLHANSVKIVNAEFFFTDLIIGKLERPGGKQGLLNYFGREELNW